jgi:cell division protein FtsB
VRVHDRQEVCMESSTVASDRLRKAIERNRAKQARRSTGPSTTRSTPSAASGYSTRRTVARPENVEFTTPKRRATRPAASAAGNVGYATSRSVVKTTPVKRRAQTKKRKTIKGQGFLLKLGWAFAGVLLVRLVFSGGGVLDYYDRKELVQNKHAELNSLGIENHSLVEEIERIQNSGKYQRKLVRDHLGFIAKDEFLILFSGEGSKSAI